MTTLHNERFARSEKYNPKWIMSGCYGSHPLWLAEWLCGQFELRPGMRVLDLGCGRAKSSIFLAREYDVQVWATDLWTSPSENLRRIADANLEDHVFPIHADASDLPFAGAFFDAVLSFDAYQYFGTNDLYLNYVTQFIKPGGIFGFASAGLMQELDADVPEHLQRFWTQDNWCIHTVAWWRRHLARTGLLELEQCGDLPDGWRLWLQWAEATECSPWYREMLRIDAGRYLGYVGLVGRRREGGQLAEYAWPSTLRVMPAEYERHDLMRSNVLD